MSVSEAAVKNLIKKRLESYGVRMFVQAADVLEPGPGFYWMPVQGQMAVHGVHDFVGLWHGVFFSIEAKAELNPQDATEPQRAFQKAVLRSGGISIVGARSPDVVDWLARQIEKRRDEPLNVPTLEIDRATDQ